MNDLRTACIGDLKAENLESGLDIVARAIDALKDNKFEYVIGPMNGNTWQSYRFLTGSDGSPSYFMEPQNPDFYPQIIKQSGFDVIGRYCSAKTNLTGEYGRKKLPEDIKLRCFNAADPHSELEKIYHLSLKAFAGNFLYTPIGRDNFIALYAPVLPYLVPDFVLMAEAGGELLGFLFAIPNYAQGKKPDQLVIKTYASLRRGIGGALVEHVHKVAQQAGFKSAIHALMHNDNVSLLNSAQYSEPFRHYELYGKRISA